MILVIGGAFRGKKEYVKQQCQVKAEEILSGEQASYEDIFHCKCMSHFHEWIKKGIKENWDFNGLETQLYEKNRNVILITNELGYGVVPMDSFDREYREITGRVCTKIAAHSEKVIRVSCGIGMVIKNA